MYYAGADGYNVPDFVCDIYFDGKKPCFGGVQALDGKTGAPIWTLWSSHEIFAVTCQGDLDGDGTPDCVAGGRAGVFFALSARAGTVLWRFESKLVQSDLMSVYAAQFLRDVSEDGVPDILAVHGGDELSDPALEEKMFGRIIIFDGRNGSILSWMATPDRREIYYPPQLLHGLDGEEYVLFGTGGSARSGSLYVISVTNLYRRRVSKAQPIYTDDEKGMLTPAALVDVNGDSVDDIVIATFNSIVIAFDGLTFKEIWSTKFAGSESYSTIAVGYYDQDQVPDFLVKYQHGQGFPVYQYEQTVVLSGKDGSKISPILTDSIGSQSSPISISVEGKGNDIFLHWMSNCKGHDKKALKYTFARGEHMHDKMRADICRSLFNSHQELTLLALQRFNATAETVIYNSLWWDKFEHSNVTSTLKMAEKYMRANPERQKSYDQVQNAEDEDKYSVVPYRRDDLNQAFFDMLEREIEKSRGDDYYDPREEEDDNGGGVSSRSRRVMSQDDQDAAAERQSEQEEDNSAERGEDDALDGTSSINQNRAANPSSVKMRQPVIDYAEGGRMLDDLSQTSKSFKPPPPQAGSGEVVQPNVVYSQPHSVHKYPAEISQSLGNYENPYRPGQVGGAAAGAQQQQQQPYATGAVNYYPHHFRSQQQQPAPDFVPGTVVNYPIPQQQQPQYPQQQQQPYYQPYQPPPPPPIVPQQNSGYGFAGAGSGSGSSGYKKLHDDPRQRRIKRSLPVQPPRNDSGSHWGIHRLLSTGTLAPPILKAEDTMDLIFSTHWVYPAKIPILQPDDVACVQRQMKGKEFENDEDGGIYEADVTAECLKRNGHLPLKADDADDSSYETPSDYNPFAVNMGQLTVYRFRLRCKCDPNLLKVSPETGQEEKCGRFLDFEDQGWPSFAGIRGDSYYNFRARMKNRRRRQGTPGSGAG